MPSGGLVILLTGTFYSENWITSHLLPLAKSKSCGNVLMVSETPVPSIENVTGVYPSKWLRRVIGGDLARIVLYFWTGLRVKPHIVGGFHISPNGLAAALLGGLIGAWSLYICGGGPREVLGGAYGTGNRLFDKLGKPDSIVERLLLKSVNCFDLVVTMGSGAVSFFRDRGVRSMFRVIPGGYDGKRFYPSEREASTDLILVGRLSRVKRVDIFLKALKKGKERIPDISAVIVGDGPDRTFLEKVMTELGLRENVRFIGHRDDVEQWLRGAKAFVLTSDSEGLSQAMIQAMLCGLPVVVSSVGDLGELVTDGLNGYLVAERNADAFARAFERLLSEPQRMLAMGRAARKQAECLLVPNVAASWEQIYDGWRTP